MPSPPALQQLDLLNRSSPNFHDQLTNILYGAEYKQCVPNLQGEDLVWLVDYLDKALDGLDPSGAASRKCLRELKKICGTRAILPTSHTISSGIIDTPLDLFAGGGYGDVYTGTLGGSKVCVKFIRGALGGNSQRAKEAKKAFCQEAVMWRRLGHPNVLPLLGVNIDCFQLISSWMPGGRLPDYVKKHSNPDRLGLLSDVAKGLWYLHSCNVVHGDLKGPNILVDDSGHARIMDFGFSRVTRNPGSTQTIDPQRRYSVRWAAPEILKEEPHSKEADIFAFAMVMVEVYTNAIPFYGNPTMAAMAAIDRGDRPPRPTHPTFTGKLWTLMQHCWDQDPCLRPEIAEVLAVFLLHPLAKPDRISLITTIFSDNSQVDMVKNLSEEDAQYVIDVIDEALESVEPQIRRRCLHFLHDMCGHHFLLPRSLTIPLCDDTMEYSPYQCGFTNVWKGQYHGQGVVAKVFEFSPASNLEKARKRFCQEAMVWKALRHPNVVPLLGITTIKTQLVMVSGWMVNGTINEFVNANPGADRLKLLREATGGLIYMHDQGIVHGTLNGANILIDSNGSARLSDFSLVTTVLDRSATTPTFLESGAIRWMSPELFDPKTFGLRDSRPTMESDCYGLGMTIYEVLSGLVPFATYRNPVVGSQVLKGKRPTRPQGKEGELFTDEIWDTLELCWKHQPQDRISASAVLLRLGGFPPPLRSSFNVDEDAETDSDDQSDTGSESSIACDENGGGWLEFILGMLEGPTGEPPQDSTNQRMPGEYSP